MHLTAIIKVLPFVLIPLLSCDERMELSPSQCNCDIDGIRLSQPSLITYQVAAHDDAFVTSITYHTNDGPVTTNHPSLPFSTTVQLATGETIALQADGNPGKGSIVLTYETNDDPHIPAVSSSSVSKVWVLEDGICR